MRRKIFMHLLFLSLFTGLATAGDVTITLSGVNPLTVNIKGTSSNQEAGSISIYIYFCDDATTSLDADNVTADILETTWGWGTWLLTKRVEEGSWTKGGHTFTKRFFYDNAGISSLDDYWTTEGINALVCSFTTVGSGHAYIEVNGSDGLADWTAHAHTITFVNQDQSLPVDLSSFSAVCEGRSVILEWVTESETDNLGFILERKTGDSEWEQIASYQTNDALKGQGNTSSKTEYAFTDTDVEPGTTYRYRVSDVSTEGKMTTYAPLSITLEDLPTVTEMDKAYPNPFNPITYIGYHLAKDSDVQISVYDMLGRKVQTLFNGPQLIGSYQIYWNGKNAQGGSAPTGTYLIRMQTENTAQVQKVLLMK